jgi:hypothetical protein
MSSLRPSSSSVKNSSTIGWHFIILMSRQGKIRLSEFFSSYTESEKRRIVRDITADVLPRQAKMCNIIEKGEYKFVYRRYASLYFCVGVPLHVNELLVLEEIHLFVEALDGYFNSGSFFVWLGFRIVLFFFLFQVNIESINFGVILFNDTITHLSVLFCVSILYASHPMYSILLNSKLSLSYIIFPSHSM